MEPMVHFFRRIEHVIKFYDLTMETCVGNIKFFSSDLFFKLINSTLFLDLIQ